MAARSLKEMVDQARETGILDFAGFGFRNFPQLSPDQGYDVDSSFFPEINEIGMRLSPTENWITCSFC